jgi:hypothetical protein
MPAKALATTAIGTTISGLVGLGWLLAQSSDPTGGWLDGIAKLGVAACLAVILYFLLVKFLPAMEARHETERKEWRKERADEREEWLREREIWLARMKEFASLERAQEVALAKAVERLERVTDKADQDGDRQ